MPITIPATAHQNIPRQDMRPQDPNNQSGGRLTPSSLLHHLSGSGTYERVSELSS
jgi:hypothetical protein